MLFCFIISEKRFLFQSFNKTKGAKLAFVLIFQKDFHCQINAGFLFFRQFPVVFQHFCFVGIQMVMLSRLNLPPDMRMSHNIINGCIEIIRHAHDSFNFRLDIKIFAFIDVRLADADGIRKFLLTDAIFSAQQFQIGQPHLLLVIILITCKNYLRNPKTSH